MTANRKNSLVLLAPCLIALATVLAYFNSFSGQFVFDDNDSIVENPVIRRLWPLRDLLTQSNRPVVNISLALNYAIGGLNPKSYHAFNMFVHLAAALLLFGLVRRTLLLESMKSRYEKVAAPVAFVVALLWAAHPIQTESVTYIIQRAESLAGLFYILTIYCVVRAATSNHSTRWLVGAVTACLLGMGSKQTAATAPLLAFAYDFTFITGSIRQTLRKRWLFYVALAATWLVLLPSFAMATVSPIESAGIGMSMFTPLTYLLTQFGVLLHYLRLSFWPASLCFDYFWRPAGGFSEVFTPAAVIGSLFVLSVVCLIARRKIGFLGIAFFLILAPTSSVMPLADAAVEHRMYLPLAAVIMATVLAAYWLLERFGKMRLLPLLIIIFAGAAVMLGFLTSRRNNDYRSAITLWSDTIQKQPGNPRAYDGLGRALMEDGQNEEALQAYSRAVELAPGFAAAWNNRAIECGVLGRFREGSDSANRAIELKPDFAPAYSTRGILLARSGKTEEAVKDFDRAIELNPNFPKAFHNRAIALTEKNDLPGAIRDHRRYLEFMPDDSRSHSDLAVCLYRTRDFAGAWREVAAVIKLGGEPQPEFVKALSAAMPRPGR